MGLTDSFCEIKTCFLKPPIPGHFPALVLYDNSLRP